ncbi:MAG: putative colanic acid biosynthesis acetyltransferase [Rhodomicrobium sp.]
MSVISISDSVETAACKRIPRPSAKSKAARLLWRIAYISVFRFSPTPMHGWRRLLLRRFGAKIGRAAVIYPSVRIWAPWALHVEDGATIGWDCEIYNVGPVHIRKRAIVSQHAFLCTASHDFQTDFQLMAAPIEIGAEAWVAADAFVGPGVSIGEGAVVAARAVVMRSTQPWTVVAGNPAKFIGMRQRSARNDLHRDGDTGS